jgi:uncharacterized membrane protein YvbJ
MFCSSCGGKLQDRAAFCAGCGAAVDGGAEQAQPQPQYQHQQQHTPPNAEQAAIELNSLKKQRSIYLIGIIAGVALALFTMWTTLPQNA